MACCGVAYYINCKGRRIAKQVDYYNINNAAATNKYNIMCIILYSILNEFFFTTACI